MIVADVVKNSIWYDPRVRKQLLEYSRAFGNDVVAIGVMDAKFDVAAVQKLPCNTDLVFYDNSKTLGFFQKLRRESVSNKELCKAIIRADPKIVHANDLNALIPAYKAAQKLKCKLIYDTHEIFLENPWVASNKLVKAVWSFFEKRMIKRVDLVVCVSHAAADYFEKKYGIAKPTVITNCISSENRILEPTEKAAPKQILNHGQFYGGRGYDIMIDAAKRLIGLKDIEMVLRGFGSMEDMLRRKVADEGITNVRFVPPVNVEELIPSAASAWVGLAITEANCLNFELSVSNKLFEYAAAGLPVIMSNIPEHRYLNQRYDFGLILENNSPECLAEAVRRLYCFPELYERLKAGCERLSREVTWDNEFARLIDLERRMLSDSAVNPA